jgi:hypothetical protein
MLAMATRNAAQFPRSTERCTEFQLHCGTTEPTNVIDFTERKLLIYLSQAQDPQQRAVLTALVEDYRLGLVAVAWRRGLPVPLRVTKDA